ncbi:MAG: transporter, partial [Gammaproteobacteria bacterium]|nr:transporter [Gammaproteobacteria bacterium]
MVLNLLINRIIIVLCLVSTVARFALDSFLPSLPSIGAAFDISSEETQLTITVYLAGFGCSQLLYGPLSDRFGRKKILIAGFIIFIAGSLFSAAADSVAILLLGRLIAGIGCGAAGVINRAIARDQYTGATFAKVWSYTTTTLVITLIIA